MIAISEKIEKVLQVNDPTRLDFSKIVITSDEGDLISIEVVPELLAPTFNITSAKYLDYAYETDGEKEITVTVTTDNTVKVFTYTIEVLTVEEDRLFSSDSDLVGYEDDIFRFLRAGRMSFLDKHREAQNNILRELDRNRITKTSGARLDKTDLYDVDEVRDWSKFMVLSMVLNSVKNEVGDVFESKSKDYLEKSVKARNSAIIRLDLNKDGRPQILDLQSARMMKR